MKKRKDLFNYQYSLNNLETFILEKISDSVILFDRKNVIQYANSNFKSLIEVENNWNYNISNLFINQKEKHKFYDFLEQSKIKLQEDLIFFFLIQVKNKRKFIKVTFSSFLIDKLSNDIYCLCIFKEQKEINHKLKYFEVNPF